MTPPFGSYELFRYPEYRDIEYCFGQKFTLVERYNPGISIRTIIDDGLVIVGDWFSNRTQEFTENHHVAMELNEKIIHFAVGVGLKSYQVFFDDEFKITDFIGGEFGFASPQMISLIFSNNFEIQVIKDMFILTPEYDKTCSGIIKACGKTTIDPIYAEILQS